MEYAHTRLPERTSSRTAVAEPDVTGLQRPDFSRADDTIHGGRLVLSELLDRGP
ncbi:hypothetical protein [Streptomyces sp. NPDC096013]|uniref:hypothetical protein n=1 Tax=Streptomyces sp. NPDC096013 TaxID=3366069 RepID=UPI0038189015